MLHILGLMYDRGKSVELKAKSENLCRYLMYNKPLYNLKTQKGKGVGVEGWRVISSRRRSSNEA